MSFQDYLIQNFPSTIGEFTMKTSRFLSFLAIFALLSTLFACSSDSPSGPSGGESPPSKPSSSSAYVPPPPPSSSSVVVKTQYYDVVLGNWSASCPSLNDYPELLNSVIAVNDTYISIIQNCLINSQSYIRNTSSEVSSFLATNGLSGFANAFDSRIAASPYNTAFLIYLNTSNYFRVLIIGYSDNSNSVPLPSSSSISTMRSSSSVSSTCDMQCVNQVKQTASSNGSLCSGATCTRVKQCGSGCNAKALVCNMCN